MCEFYFCTKSTKFISYTTNFKGMDCSCEKLYIPKTKYVLYKLSSYKP